LAVDHNLGGIQSTKLHLTYNRVSSSSAQTFTFQAGGLVWTSSSDARASLVRQGSLAFATKQTPPGGGVAKTPLQDLRTLATLNTSAQFEAQVPTLLTNSTEQRIKAQLPADGLGDLVYKLVLASNRIALSSAAKHYVNEWPGKVKAYVQAQYPTKTDSQLKTQVLAELENEISPVLKDKLSDPLGLDRVTLLTAISNASHVAVYTRALASFALARGVETFPGLNALGRHHLRIALIRAYLSTNPPSTEATGVVGPIVTRIADPIAMFPIKTLLSSQYPEIWYAYQFSQGSTP
jgi:hypothetical protein